MNFSAEVRRLKLHHQKKLEVPEIYKHFYKNLRCLRCETRLNLVGSSVG